MDSSTEYSNVELLDAPDKSPYDKNQYRIIRLPNGIKTLLISAYDGTVSSSETTNASTEAQASAETESANEYLSGASLVVDVGSFSNPPDVQGLAHLLGTLTRQNEKSNIFSWLFHTQSTWSLWDPKNTLRQLSSPIS